MTDTTDREMLKLASKAAGYQVEDTNAAAFRLQVDLKLTISSGGGGPLDKHKTNIRVWRFGVPAIFEKRGEDPCAAARRAVFRAAAEIGRKLP